MQFTSGGRRTPALEEVDKSDSYGDIKLPKDASGTKARIFPLQVKQ